MENKSNFEEKLVNYFCSDFKSLEVQENTFFL